MGEQQIVDGGRKIVVKALRPGKHHNFNGQWRIRNLQHLKQLEFYLFFRNVYDRGKLIDNCRGYLFDERSRETFEA